jgi:predicted regulator of Ras-like GTPase activity (Roadblock/LC7/MglB family)
VDNILNDLNQAPGVKGSMVMTPDGMVVAAVLGPTLEEEVVAATAANMIIRAQRAVEALSLETVDRFVMTAGHGRLVFVNIEVGFLVVIASQGLKLDTTMLEIDSAARRIRHRRPT